MPRLVEISLCWLTFQVAMIPIHAFQAPPYQRNHILPSTTMLFGKLWDKLGIEPDPLDEEAGWYLMNCIVGSELDLLAQAKHVTKGLPTEQIEKLVVPLERKVRSHGKTQNVVEMKVMYPGYVFCKMRISADTYEPLQQLPLCRSWMAGTVNQKGYKKLPPAPIALSDDEVAKFKGLEEQTDALFDKFGEDYTGRGDDGMDLMHQYEGYKVENMVKILKGNFKGEDGVVRRLKDGLIMVRLYTYGNVLDQWFQPNEIRPMTDAEAMKGLTGPSTPVNQDQFDISIGKSPRPRDRGERTLRSSLMSSMGGSDGGNRRMRREDRISRGERGNKDIYGRTDQEIKEEEQNWRQFREEQRASQQQKRGDVWGIKERTSWDSGDDAAQFDNGQWKSGRQMRREKKTSSSTDSDQLNNAIDGEGDWDIFSNDSRNQKEQNTEEDDFFSSLMSELSDTLDESPVATTQNNDNTRTNSMNEKTKEDDFFNSLMSELSDSLEKPLKSSPKNRDITSDIDPGSHLGDTNDTDDDFFTDLMSQLSDSKEYKGQEDRNQMNDTSDEMFFTSLEADLNESLNYISASSSQKVDPNSEVDNELFTGLESQLDKNTLTDLTVPVLKSMLKERGLKVGGNKSDLIARLVDDK